MLGISRIEGSRKLLVLCVIVVCGVFAGQAFAQQFTSTSQGKMKSGKKAKGFGGKTLLRSPTPTETPPETFTTTTCIRYVNTGSETCEAIALAFNNDAPSGQSARFRSAGEPFRSADCTIIRENIAPDQTETLCTQPPPQGSGSVSDADCESQEQPVSEGTVTIGLAMNQSGNVLPSCTGVAFFPPEIIIYDENIEISATHAPLLPLNNNQNDEDSDCPQECFPHHPCPHHCAPF